MTTDKGGCAGRPPDESITYQRCYVVSCHCPDSLTGVFCMCKGRLCAFFCHMRWSVCVHVRVCMCVCVCYAVWCPPVHVLAVHPADCCAARPLCRLLAHWFAGLMPTTAPIVPTLKRMKEPSLSHTHTHAHTHSPVCQTRRTITL